MGLVSQVSIEHHKRVDHTWHAQLTLRRPCSSMLLHETWERPRRRCPTAAPDGEREAAAEPCAESCGALCEHPSGIAEDAARRHSKPPARLPRSTPTTTTRKPAKAPTTATVS